MRLTVIAVVTVLSIAFGVFVLSAAENYTFVDDIKPVLQSNGCAGCHSFAQTYDGLMTKMSGTAATINVPMVNPAKPDSSVIVWRLEGKLPSGSSIDIMPIGGDKLSNTVIQKVRDWITRGAPEDATAVDDSRKWGEIKTMFR